MSVPGLSQRQWVGVNGLGWGQGFRHWVEGAGLKGESNAQTMLASSPERVVSCTSGDLVLASKPRKRVLDCSQGADQLNTLMACSRGAGVVVYIPETKWWPYAGIYVYPKHQSS